MPVDFLPSPSTVIEVRTPARLHLGMLSFGVPGTRSYGGVGVMVDRPGVQLRLRLANRLEGRGPQAERAVKFARACIETWGMGQVGCSLEVLAAPPSHAGLGSGTQLGLAVAAGIRHLFSEPPGDAGDEAAGPESLDATEHDWLFDIRDVMDLARVVGRGRR